MTCVHGSAAPFLDAAVQSVANNGMLMVTCTDMATLSGPNQDVRAAVLSSSSPCGVRSRAATQACFGRYGCVGIRGVYHHELAVRMLLSALRQCAARYGRHVQPLLSLSVDFYVRRRQGTLRSGSAPQDLPPVAQCCPLNFFSPANAPCPTRAARQIRVFVRVKTRKAAVLQAPLETGMVMQVRCCIRMRGQASIDKNRTSALTSRPCRDAVPLLPRLLGAAARGEARQQDGSGDRDRRRAVPGVRWACGDGRALLHGSATGRAVCGPGDRTPRVS